MRPIYIALAAILITGKQAAAQQAPKPMSLEDCVEYAMKHNYTVKNAQLDVLIQKAVNDQTVALSLPQVSGKADLNYFINPQKQFIAAKSFNPAAPDGMIMPIAFSLNYATSASLSASQILFDGSVAVALQARNALMELARQNGKVSETTVRYNVTKSYYSAIVVRNQIANIRKMTAYLRDVQHEMEVMHTTGVVDKISTDRITVQVNNLVTDSMRLENMAKLTEQVMKYQMGMDINEPVELTDNNLDSHIENAAKLLNEEQTYVKVPEYGLVQTSIKLNEYNLKRFKMAALPTLAAFGAYGTNYGQNDFGKLYELRHFESYSLVGVQMTMTLFGGMKRLNEVKETRLNLEKSQNNLASLKQGIDFMTTQAKTTLRNSLLQIQNQKRNVALAQDVLDLAQKTYKAGVGSNLDVSQAETELLRAQNDYFTTMLDIVSSEADLKKALGQL